MALFPLPKRQAESEMRLSADEAPHWDQLHARFLTKRINHSKVYSDGES